MSSEFREPVITAYPTSFKLPLWFKRVLLKKPPSLTIAFETLRISNFTVNRVSDVFSLKGLMKSPYMPNINPALNPADIISEVKAMAPVDGSEVVEWMQIAAAENIVLQARIAEYNALGSQVVGGSGDPYIPGLTVEDISLERIAGVTVTERGYAIAYTPYGTYNVPRLGKATGIYRNHLSWASISYVGAVQWVASLLKWRELATTPITQPVGFYMDSRGNTAPHFFIQAPPRPTIMVKVRQKYECDKDQSILITFRDPYDYTRVIFTRSIGVKSGVSEVKFDIIGLPYVPPMMAEIQPENGVQTKLNEYTVY